MTPLLWGLVWLVVAILLALLIGRAIRLADESQERALARRRHPSGRVPPYDVRRPVPGGPVCLVTDRPCGPTCSPGWPTCRETASA